MSRKQDAVGRGEDVMTNYTFHRPVKRAPAARRRFRGRVYHSLTERVRAVELQALLESGNIVAWFPQVPVDLGLDFSTRVDFLVVGGDHVWIEEVKGFDTAEFRRIVRLWKKYGPLPMVVLWAERAGAAWRVEKIDAGRSGGTLDSDTADGD